MNKLITDAATRILIEGARRSLEDPSQDIVEHSIDVAFEPLEKVADIIDSIFKW